MRPHECAFDITVGEVKQLRDDAADLLLVDCRQPDEHAFAAITGALLMPMAELPERLGELEPYRDRRIVVYCHHGPRSRCVTEWLREQGFPRVQNMDGGIDAWSERIDSSVPRY